MIYSTCGSKSSLSTQDSVITPESNPYWYGFAKNVITFLFVYIPTIEAVMQFLLIVADLYRMEYFELDPFHSY